VGEGANRPKAQCHPDLACVYAADRWSESHASYPGRSLVLLETARAVERRHDGAGEVSNGQSSPAESRQRTTHEEETGTMSSREEADAGKKVERPEPKQRNSGGTAKGTLKARQTSPAHIEAAGNEKECLLEKVLGRENVLAAYQRVKTNGGAAGIDGMTVEELMGFCQNNWTRIRQELLEGTYRPQPVKKVDIPKPDGETRSLGIPTVMDRMIQQALLQVLQPQWDPTFSNDSFGYRPGRSAQQAVVRAREHIRAGNRWVVDLDLEKFFDRVNHDVLMARVARRVKDKRVLLLIRRYLQAGMMEGGLVSPRTEGTPQGSPLSPLLSNLLLDELDRELEKRGHGFVRYADDTNVYVRSEAAGQRVMASLEVFLEKRLRLKVNRTKSAVARPWKRKLLGYSFTVHRETKLKVSDSSIKRLKTKLREVTREGRGGSFAQTMATLGPIIRGWVAYYRLSEVRGSFELLDQWLRHRLRSVLWRQWKRRWTRFKELTRRGIAAQRAWDSVSNGRGPWWNAGASHMNQAVTALSFRNMGLLSFLDVHSKLKPL
jgi:RNA-directed DNA polymerase